MAAHEGRALGTVVQQEGDVAIDKANGLVPRQDNVTVFPMQLTRPDIQALDCYQNYKDTVPQASRQFGKLEELINPPLNHSPTGNYNFNFLLSDVDKEETQHTSSIYSSSQLSRLSLMEDKGMAYKTTNSYQMTQVRRPQEEEESSNKVKKFGKLTIVKRAPIRKALQTVPDPVPQRKRTTPINPAYTIRKSRVANSVHMRPYRDRVIHLLALKDYMKSELLLRLQKDGKAKDDKNSLGEILHQVANFNTQNFSYTLKDYIFKELQKDWPGYNDIDRQSLELLLSRKADTFQNASGTERTESSQGSGTDKILEEQFSSLAHINLLKTKVRISHLTTATQSMSKSHSNNTSAKATVGLSRPSGSPDNSLTPSLPPDHLPLPNSSQPSCSNSKSCSFARGTGTQDPGVNSYSKNMKIFVGEQGKHPSLETLPPISVQRNFLKCKKEKRAISHKNSKCKFREHKAKKQEHNSEMRETQKPDLERQEESAQPNPNEGVEEVYTASDKTCSASGCPDYLANYVTIMSSEQRQHYEQEFQAEYDEYQALHAKMLTLSQVFINLDSERKHFSPDSEEYQNINKKISLEYKNMIQINPNYYGEKHRCQYLYNKLGHIKRLINYYDEQQI